LGEASDRDLSIASIGGLLTVYAGDALARGNCLKVVSYGYITNIIQEYGGSEVGGYCR
jgi:hypothetical protein